MLKHSKRQHIKKVLLLEEIPLVLEQMRGAHTISLGIWVKIGSRYEPSYLRGISHFLEHAVFKGTRKRSYRDIAIEIDSLGGEINAFTTKEFTSFYIRVPDTFLLEGLEILMDLFLDPVFPEEEIEKEKLVVMEEIKTTEDTPDDLVYDLFSETVWNGNGLGERILGRVESILSFSPENLRKYKKDYYGIPNLVISCAGDFDEIVLKDKLEEYLGRVSRSKTPETLTPMFNYGINIMEKDLQEVHLVCGTEGIPQISEERFAAMLLNTIVGSGVSSRLFQKIREEKALAYNVYSFINSYRDTGTFGVYLGCSKERFQEALDLTRKELFSLKDTIDRTELERAKKHLKGHLLMSLDSSMARMKNLAMQEIYHGRCMSPEEIIEQIEKVNLQQVKEVAERFFGPQKLAISAVGPVSLRELD